MSVAVAVAVVEQQVAVEAVDADPGAIRQLGWSPANLLCLWTHEQFFSNYDYNKADQVDRHWREFPPLLLYLNLTTD